MDVRFRPEADIPNLERDFMSYRSLLIIVCALFPLLASAHDKPCHTDIDKRIVVGRQPTAKYLYARIRHVKMGAWNDGFWDETFTYIGDVHSTSGKIYKIAYLSTIWGESCHATNRLFVFNGDNKYLGQYDDIMVDPMKIKIRGTQIIFPYDTGDGNKLDLELGPPSKAWLDGENPEWSPAQPPKQN
jgi:hypothetical protein